MIRRLGDDPSISHLIRQYDAGQPIFKQGERGDTMYVVDSGYVRITGKLSGIEQLVAIVPPGEVIGEKGILERTMYRRNFSARAQTVTTLVELDADALVILKALIPDIELRILRMALDRLSKANELASVLQAREPMERLAGYIRYFIRHYCTSLPQDEKILVSATELCIGANVPMSLVEACLKNLLKYKAARKEGDGFVLSSMEVFEAHVAKMGEATKTPKKAA
jgi:CRP-like cAMP-binding protein